MRTGDKGVASPGHGRGYLIGAGVCAALIVAGMLIPTSGAPAPNGAPATSATTPATSAPSPATSAPVQNPGAAPPQTPTARQVSASAPTPPTPSVTVPVQTSQPAAAPTTAQPTVTPITGAAPACTPVNTATQYVQCGQDGSSVCGVYKTPAPLFGTLSGWRCSVEVGAGASLAVYTVQHSCAGLAQAMTCRQETISQATTLLAAGGCPGPIHGTIGGAGNRIPLTVRIVGPAGTRTFSAILDTGGVDTQLPNADMLAVGLTPTTETTASWPLVSSAPVKEWTYTAGYPEVYDNGAWVPLGLGTTTIHGTDIPAGMSPLIGPDVLKAGTALSTDGSAFTLTPPCAGTREG